MLVQTAALGPAEAVHRVEDRSIIGPEADLPIRIYSPVENKARRALVYFHGGGWVIGSIETHDGLCRMLANRAACTVVSVEYRLAPEHKFPAAAEDAYAAVRWAAEHAEELGADATRLAVGGDSAGGNLAAVVCLMARDRKGPPIDLQVLLYPITDYDLDTQSYLAYADRYLLTRDAMSWFWQHYLADEADKTRPYVSPLRAPDLSRLPRALIITAECDPLCDEGDAYARRLEAAGVAVTHACYAGMVHGFVRRATLLAQGRKALDQIAAALTA
ncbi:MAG TPA: alpha/beta hydrolase, partial [Pirellulales bacterium]|nr:alpha/beta hydrolase [Pirellulales bacterium]